MFTLPMLSPLPMPARHARYAETMSTHIGAAPGAIAPHVLMPGDPLRARWIAENFLEGVVQYNDVRGMLGYSGTYRGVEVATQGSGMGQPSLAIYATELLRDYDVESIIRVGTAGAVSDRVKVRDVVLAQTASTDSAMNRLRFDGIDYAPFADFGLLRTAAEVAEEQLVTTVVGGLFSSDQFYHPRPEISRRLADYGVLAIEMETSALYTIAAEFGKKALTICTISDHLLTGEETSAQERQETFSDMVELALETVRRSA